MALPTVSGEFAVVFEPELRFNTDGKAWLPVRGVAKDRRYNNETKAWEDYGDPCFIDIVISGREAENFVESMSVGDLFTVTGNLIQRNWEKDGEKKQSYQIRCKDLGVSIKFGPAKTPKTLGTAPAAAGNTSKAEAQDEFAPF